jgi:hypothetical protein
MPCWANCRTQKLRGGSAITKLSVLKRRTKLGIAAAKLRAPVKRLLGGAMRVSLPKALAEKPIRDLTADEYLAAAQRISQ